MEQFFEPLNYEKVKIALNTNKQFTFLVRRKSVSIWYKDGGYTSFFKEDLYKRYKYKINWWGEHYENQTGNLSLSQNESDKYSDKSQMFAELSSLDKFKNLV